MRLHGYCERCHKVKLVRVNMARFGMGRRTPIGICGSCEEREAERRRAR